MRLHGNSPHSATRARPSEEQLREMAAMVRRRLELTGPRAGLPVRKDPPVKERCSSAGYRMKQRRRLAPLDAVGREREQKVAQLTVLSADAVRHLVGDDLSPEQRTALDAGVPPTPITVEGRA